MSDFSYWIPFLMIGSLTGLEVKSRADVQVEVELGVVCWVSSGCCDKEKSTNLLSLFCPIPRGSQEILFLAG